MTATQLPLLNEAELIREAPLRPNGTEEALLLNIRTSITTSTDKVVLSMAPYSKLPGVQWFVEAGSEMPKLMAISATETTIPTGTKIYTPKEAKDLGELPGGCWFMWRKELYRNVAVDPTVLQKDAVVSVAEKLVSAASDPSVLNPESLVKKLDKMLSAIPALSPERAERVASKLGMLFVSFPMYMYRSLTDTYTRNFANTVRWETSCDDRWGKMKPESKETLQRMLGKLKLSDYAREVTWALYSGRSTEAMEYTKAKSAVDRLERNLNLPPTSVENRKVIAFAKREIEVMRSYANVFFLEDEMARIVGVESRDRLLADLRIVEEIRDNRKLWQDTPQGYADGVMEAAKAAGREDLGMYNVTISSSDVLVHMILKEVIKRDPSRVGYLVAPSESNLPECLAPHYGTLCEETFGDLDFTRPKESPFAQWQVAMDSHQNWAGVAPDLAADPDQAFVIKGQFLYGVRSDKFDGAEVMLTGKDGRRWMDLLSFDVNNTREIKSTSVRFADVDTLKARPGLPDRSGNAVTHDDSTLVLDKKHCLGDGTVAFLTPDVYGDVVVPHDVVFQGRMMVMERGVDGAKDRMVAFYKGTVVVSKNAPNVLAHRAAYGLVDQVSEAKLSDGSQYILMWDKSHSEEEQSPGSISDQSVTFNGSAMGAESIFAIDYAKSMKIAGALGAVGHPLSMVGPADVISATRSLGDMKRSVGPSQYAISAELYLWSNEEKDRVRARRILRSGYDAMNLKEVLAAENLVTVPVGDWRWFEGQKVVDKRGRAVMRVNLNRHPFMAHGGSCHSATVLGKTRGNFFVVDPRSYSMAGLDFDGDKLFCTADVSLGGELRPWKSYVQATVQDILALSQVPRSLRTHTAAMWLSMMTVSAPPADRGAYGSVDYPDSNWLERESVLEADEWLATNAPYGSVNYPQGWDSDELGLSIETRIFCAVFKYFSQGRKGLQEIKGGFGPRLYASVCNEAAANVVGRVDVLLRTLFHRGQYVTAIRMVTILQAFIDRQKKNFAGDVENPGFCMDEIIAMCQPEAERKVARVLQEGRIPDKDPPRPTFSKLLTFVTGVEVEKDANSKAAVQNIKAVKELHRRVRFALSYIAEAGLDSHFDSSMGKGATLSRFVGWLSDVQSVIETALRGLSAGHARWAVLSDKDNGPLQFPRTPSRPAFREIPDEMPTYLPRAVGLLVAAEHAADGEIHAPVASLNIFRADKHKEVYIERDPREIAREIKERLRYMRGAIRNRFKSLQQSLPTLAEEGAANCLNYETFCGLAGEEMLKSLGDTNYREVFETAFPANKHFTWQEVCPAAVEPTTEFVKNEEGITIAARLSLPVFVVRGKGFSGVVIEKDRATRTVKGYGQDVSTFSVPRYRAFVPGVEKPISLTGRELKTALADLRRQWREEWGVEAEHFITPEWGFRNTRRYEVLGELLHEGKPLPRLCIYTNTKAERIDLAKHADFCRDVLNANIIKMNAKYGKGGWVAMFSRPSQLSLQLAERMATTGIRVACRHMEMDEVREEDLFNGIIFIDGGSDAEVEMAPSPDANIIVHQLGLPLVRVIGLNKDVSFQSYTQPTAKIRMHLVNLITTSCEDLEERLDALLNGTKDRILFVQKSNRDNAFACLLRETLKGWKHRISVTSEESLKISGLYTEKSKREFFVGHWDLTDSSLRQRS